jgi:hypothetical protein
MPWLNATDKKIQSFHWIGRKHIYWSGKFESHRFEWQSFNKNSHQSFQHSSQSKRVSFS